MSGRSSLHGAPPEYACMHEQGMVCCRKVLLLPGTAYQCHSVSGRTGFANFTASLATLPLLVLGENPVKALKGMLAWNVEIAYTLKVKVGPMVKLWADFGLACFNLRKNTGKGHLQRDRGVPTSGLLTMPKHENHACTPS
eukprot:368947-Pelagomonas_calceolata.AAC.2